MTVIRTHTVRYAETLSSLAQKYYGDAGWWESIYQANRHYIANPNALDPGQVLVIPHLYLDEARRWLGLSR